jgi:glutathione-regulated potassium-efflux system ancillary protein KefF
MASERNTVVIFGHPYPKRSRAGRTLLAAIRDLPNLSVRSLYDSYPDFGIDVEAEQQALREADIIVWQTPFYWYGVPSLMHLWFEKVLEQGFAYGEGGNKLSGKRVQWVTTTGTPRSSYRANGVHGHSFETFVPHIEQTARFCGMLWEPPIVVHGAHDISNAELEACARGYRSRLEILQNAEGPLNG